ncbi:MAG: hypothetical protein LBN05_05750 [Oscillospiraceae bacterium]|jgi:hypothetical protein|nr:hypothetical protein [Oscillospiraceae bacterium]
MSASDVLWTMLIVFDVIVCLVLAICLIGWIWEHIPDARRMPSVRVRLQRIAMRAKMYKAAHDMIRTAEDCAEQEDERGSGR